MEWLSWVLLVLGLMAVFAVWDLVFCGGRRCHGLIDRLPDRFRLGGPLGRGTDPRSPRPSSKAGTPPK